MPDLSAVRRAAWVTRRQKYGERGHGSSYARTRLERRALSLIARLCNEGALSEGQCCAALDLDRIAWRTICDQVREKA